jgi:hypothetical protein
MCELLSLVSRCANYHVAPSCGQYLDLLPPLLGRYVERQ